MFSYHGYKCLVTLVTLHMFRYTSTRMSFLPSSLTPCYQIVLFKVTLPVVYLAEICRDISAWSLNTLVLLDFCSVVSFGSVSAFIQLSGRKRHHLGFRNWNIVITHDWIIFQFLEYQFCLLHINTIVNATSISIGTNRF